MQSNIGVLGATAMAAAVLAAACSTGRQPPARLLSPTPPATPGQPGTVTMPSASTVIGPASSTSPPVAAANIRASPPAKPLAPTRQSPAPPSFITSSEPSVAQATPGTVSRLAPDVTLGQLRFTRVSVFAGANGQFAGRANLTNAGPDYLNDLKIQWSVVDAGGTVLDWGTVMQPNLAPGETATVNLAGPRPYTPAWAAVRFSKV